MISERLPMVTLSMIPALPQNMQPSPTFVEPAMPTCDAMPHMRPICTLCAIITRLSIFVPAPMRVSRRKARSMQVFAPISTSSSNHHGTNLRDFYRAEVNDFITIPIRTQHHAGMQNNAATDLDAFQHANAGVQEGACAVYIAPNKALRTDFHAVAYFRASLHHGQRADGNAHPQTHGRIHHRAGVDAFSRFFIREPQIKQAQPALPYVIDNHAGTVGDDGFFRDEKATRLAGRRFVQIFFGSGLQDQLALQIGTNVIVFAVTH